MDCKISVIIPTLNEQENIQHLVRQLKGIDDLEMIVADGGSTDGTLRLLEGSCKVVQSVKGRAKQMNAGARIAKGNVLWFLHADSIVVSTMPSSICKVMRGDESVIGGGFSLRFDDPSILLKWIAIGSDWRAKLSNIFFGDQGFFIRRSVFEEIGGFPSEALMEDWIISQRSKKYGKLVLLPEPIVTSSRRFRKKGIIRTFLLMKWIAFLFLLGVPTEHLERMYRRG